MQSYIKQKIPAAKEKLLKWNFSAGHIFSFHASSPWSTMDLLMTVSFGTEGNVGSIWREDGEWFKFYLFLFLLFNF